MEAAEIKIPPKGWFKWITETQRCKGIIRTPEDLAFWILLHKNKGRHMKCMICYAAETLEGEHDTEFFANFT